MATDVALVTGASSGIGAALARRLAQDGRALALVARRLDRLEGLAAEITAQHGVAAHAIRADLTQPGAVEALLADVAGRDLVVDCLVNNAGFGTLGRFQTLPVEREIEEIALNVEALVELTARCVPGMVARGRGVVMNVGSIGSYLPSPGMATYTATKAFVLLYSESIAAELNGTGVHVLCVCPGFTSTEFQELATVDVDKVPSLMRYTAEDVADEAVRAIGRTSVVVTGRLNRLMLAPLKVVPRGLAMRVASGFLQAKEG